ncbi:MAG: signal recognition particle-docking protein FtsY [Planctomycetia bacterium]|nr:signal recognition particle-docking protein FtsY [Planctomycetia bacterium]
MGLFGLIKRGLQKTTRILNTDIRDLFKSEGRLVDDAFLEELFASLIRTDLGVASAQKIIEEIRTDYRGRVVQMEEVVAHVKKELKLLMKQDTAPIALCADGPTVIMVCGVNGSGKTTSIAKLTKMFRNQKKSVVLGAADTFRAAAVDQLKIWAERLGAEIVTGKPNSDPASVAFNAVDFAVKNGRDVCIVDTAGRLQTQQNLMRELEKIHRVIGKVIPDAPHEVLLVLDATTGQNGISQATHFSESVHCTGLILAKLDGTAKGGVAVAIRQQVNIPVKYVGVGEQADDFALFQADDYVDAMFSE